MKVVPCITMLLVPLCTLTHSECTPLILFLRVHKLKSWLGNATCDILVRARYMYRNRTVHGFMPHTHHQANKYVLARLALDSTNAPYSGAIMTAELTGQTLPVPTLHSSSLATVTIFDLRASIIMTLLSNSVFANDVNSHNVTAKEC